MRSIGSATRSAYLSGDVTPTLTATLRQLRLQFQDSAGDPLPLVYSTYNIIDAGVYASDDKEGRIVWGDSCTNGAWKLRLINKAVWGDTADYFATITDQGGAWANWAYADITNSATTPAASARIGVYDAGGTTTRSFYVWYVNANSVYRETLSYNTGTQVWSWASKTGSGASVVTPGYDACAIHPVSASEAFVVGFKDCYLWCKYLKWSGSDWNSSGSAWTIWSSQDLEANDAYFSDAEDLDGAGSFVLTVNLASHGAAHSIIYNSATDNYSQPFSLLGAAPDDSTLRCTPMGLTRINSRVWSIQYRCIEGSDGVPYAHHVGLASTDDGRHWRDEGFVGTHYCTGKLLHVSSENYCVVVGNAVVYRGIASNKLGYDNANLKKTITEADSWQISCGGAGSATTVESNLLNVSSALSNSTLLRADNELTVSIGVSGETPDTLMKAYLGRRSRQEQYAIDRYRIHARGPLYWLAGAGAYQPPAGKLYQSPTAWHTNFTSDTGTQRQSIATVTGTWSATKPADRAKWCMKGQPETDGEPGICVVPRSISSPWLTCTTHFKAKIDLQGIFLVFFYEDSENYWRAGLYDNAGTMTLRIDRVVSGVATNKASTSTTATTDAWYSLYLDLRPGMVRVYFKNSDTEDFSSATASRTYALTGETTAPPIPYHIGLSVLDRPDETAGDDYGTVTKAFAKQIQDNTKDFTSSVLGKYVHCSDDWRQVVDYTVVQDDDGDNIALTVDTAWSEIPRVGDAWGLWSTNGSPYAIFHDLHWCDGLPAWTLDDIVNDILATSGLGRTAVYNGSLSAIGSTIQYKDLDVSITGETAPSVIVHASTTSSYTGWKVEVDDSYIYLYHQVSGGGWSLLRKYPNLIALTLTDTPGVRVVVSDGNVYVYADNHYVGCFPHIETPGYGYCAENGTGTYSTTEFCTMQDVFVWGAEEDGNGALMRLLRGRRAKLVERADGTVSVSEYYAGYDTRDDLGTWDTPVVSRGQEIEPVPSFIELFGAEVRAYYLEPETALYGLRFRRSDNHTVITEAETLEEAKRMTELAREQGEGLVVQLYAPDPACEVEDEVTVNGQEYIVSGYSIVLSRGARGIKSGMQASLRLKVTEDAPGTWGTSNHGRYKYG